MFGGTLDEGEVREDGKQPLRLQQTPASGLTISPSCGEGGACFLRNRAIRDKMLMDRSPLITTGFCEHAYSD